MTRRLPSDSDLIGAVADMETSVAEMREWCTVASLGENLRERWEAATGFGGVQR